MLDSVKHDSSTNLIYGDGDVLNTLNSEFGLLEDSDSDDDDSDSGHALANNGN